MIVNGDFDNPYQPITGINVQPPPVTDEVSEGSQMMMIGGVLLLAVLGIGMFMARGRESEDFYYDDDDEDYYEDDSWDTEAEEEEKKEEEEEEDAE
ncbi:MAG: hypothetical protein ABGX11_03840 [Candidatus Poseidoniia archaeon]